jgi:hypothetical protein
VSALIGAALWWSYYAYDFEFFSDFVSNAIAIGQVKEITRHGSGQRRCLTHVPKSAG